MKTRILYYEDTYLADAIAEVVRIDKDENGQFVVLDQTNFYPQGGGQPTDTGTINRDKSIFSVTKVNLQPDGTIYHYGSFNEEEFKPGDKVSLKVDMERRLLNARIHTAGHLLAFEAEKLYPQLVAKKGYHFPDGPYVEFEGSLTEDEKVEAKEPIQQAVQEKISSAIQVETKLVNVDELKVLCKHIPQNLPTNKPTRAMIVQTQALGCGGTHLANTKEIGSFSIRKIKNSKGLTKISYALE